MITSLSAERISELRGVFELVHMYGSMHIDKYEIDVVLVNDVHSQKVLVKLFENTAETNKNTAHTLAANLIGA